MTATLLIRRMLLCCLALCVAGPGPSAYAFRPVETEAGAHAEEVALHETTRRQNAGRARQPAPAIRAEILPRIARAAVRAVDSATALSSLRASNVRMQV